MALAFLRPNGIIGYAKVPQGVVKAVVLILFPYLNLVITGKTIHERKYFMSGTVINDLVNDRSGKIVLWTWQVQIIKVSIDMNGTLFFINGNRIGNPSGICNGIYKTRFMQFLDLKFDCMILWGVNGSFL